MKGQSVRRAEPACNRGMTLIEVLVALAIVAVTLSAGIKAAGGLGVNAQRMTDLTLAQMCAENQLTAMKLSRLFPPVGDSDFTCQQMGRTLPGRLVVRPTPNLNFRRVDAQVLDEANQPIVRLSTILPRF
ncbi:type II secretion system minor pseudopilin GspI [uncultured Aquabacterium sp.]|uniref:type II secretion system minor pseudopilin GspI n=1 Tax=uncultured Aquabacterium sp. TaxID=158753 RepID=UPI0026028303|nr:type II secretion system minor pseudopilin GspI [uncultured Aquabacterium sp.]